MRRLNEVMDLKFSLLIFKQFHGAITRSQTKNIILFAVVQQWSQHVSNYHHPFESHARQSNSLITCVTGTAGVVAGCSVCEIHYFCFSFRVISSVAIARRSCRLLLCRHRVCVLSRLLSVGFVPRNRLIDRTRDRLLHLLHTNRCQVDKDGSAPVN